MSDKQNIAIKEKTRKIFEVLPKLDDQRCGYKTCGEFVSAVALGKAPCYGCVSGGPEVAANVCKIVGVKAPEQAITRFNSVTEFHPSGFGGRAESEVMAIVWVEVVDMGDKTNT